METFDNFAGKQHLCITRISTFSALLLKLRNFGIAAQAQKVVPIPHQIIRNRHHFAKHIVGRIRNADVVLLALAHLLYAVKPHQKRHRQNALRFLTILTLQFTPDEQIEALIGSAEFQICLQGDRIVALHERVQEFVHRDRQFFLEALGKIIALQETGERVAARELNETGRTQRIAPLRVVANFRLVQIKHHAGLVQVSLSIGFNLFARQGRTSGVAARRIPNGSSEVTHQKDYGMAEILKLAKLIEHYRVTNMNVRRRRVKPEFAAKRFTGSLGTRELLFKLGLNEERVGSPRDKCHGFANIVGHGKLFLSLCGL